MIYRLHAWLLCALLALAPAGAIASQPFLGSPTTGTVSGLQLTNNYNNALDGVNTCNSGASAPTNQLTGSPSLGNCWLNTATGAVSFYDGVSTWVTVGYIDATNHVFTPITAAGAATNVTSATTTNLCGSAGAAPIQTNLTIIGTTTITGFGSNCGVGQLKILTFAGVLALTYNSSSLILPTSSPITTRANDVAVAMYLGSGNWQVVIYQRADGTPLSTSSVFVGAIFRNGAITPASLSANQNNYNPSGLATANLIRQASTANVNITGLVAPATNGQWLAIENINALGGSIITLTAYDPASTGANEFCLAHPIGILPQQSVSLVYDSTALCWRQDAIIRAHPVAGASFKNARLTNNTGGTPNNQLIYTADELVVEDANGNTVRLRTVSCSADITAVGAGGLDVGSVAQGTGYYFWIIYNPAAGGTISCLWSTQSAFGSVSFPSGYTFAARVGWDYVENAAGKRLNRILCTGRSCHYLVTASTATATLPVVTNSTGGNLTPAAVTGIFVPATAARIRLVLQATVSGATPYVSVAPSASYAAAPNSAPPPPCGFLTNNGGATAINELCDLTLESGSIYHTSQGAGGTIGGFSVSADGWEDNI
jgi:hypothetical protein